MVESESGRAFLAASGLMHSGDASANAGDYAQAVAHYEKAIAVAREAPGHDWDQQAFLAKCHAVLCGPLLQLGRTEAALLAADTALEFYDRHGHSYPASQEHWYTARRNKAVALSILRRFDEALPILEQTKAMLSSSPEAEPVRKSIDEQIAEVKNKAVALNTLRRFDEVKARASRQRKPWWRFW